MFVALTQDLSEKTLFANALGSDTPGWYLFRKRHRWKSKIPQYGYTSDHPPPGWGNTTKMVKMVVVWGNPPIKHAQNIQGLGSRVRVICLDYPKSNHETRKTNHHFFFQTLKKHHVSQNLNFLLGSLTSKNVAFHWGWKFSFFKPVF